MQSIINWREAAATTKFASLRPRVHDRTEWPPDYGAIWQWRLDTVKKLEADADFLAAAKTYYSTRAQDFIMDWMDTYDPRRPVNKWIPFVFFPKQAELVDFFEGLDHDQESGLVEKARDMGATWDACAYSVWRWLFIDNDAIGWGSRKEALVDKLGDPDSIFEKMRLLLKRLPTVFMPKDFNWSRHATFMKLTNPENGSIVSGEAGDNIGRGGRKSVFFKDEAQPLTSNVLTAFGWMKMGDVLPDQQIIGSDGKIQFVTAINPCGMHNVYSIEFTDGTSCEVSENHLWTVEKMLGSKVTKTLSTAELLKDYKYQALNGQIQYRYRVPITAPVEFRGFSEPILHPYIVGALLGDGSIGNVPKYSPKITTVDTEMIDSFIELLPEWCTITQEKDRITWRLGDIRGRQGWKHKSRIRETIVEIGIAGKRAWEKSIPDNYKFSTVENRIAILQGLLDTDGSASNGGSISFHTSSQQLADDVRFITQSLGGTATLNIKKDKRSFRDQFVLHLVLPDFIEPFRLSRKRDAIRKRKNLTDKRIRKIEFKRKDEVKCISVSNKDGLYLTDNCILTHNSAHYERPEKIESALGDNTNVQIDISSVNGLGNVFHRRAEHAVTWQPGKIFPKGFVRKFVMDWRDHPLKTQEWYDTRRAKYEREGMLHVFAQEVDRNYSAAVSNTVIPYEWIRAAVDAHIHVPYIAAVTLYNLGKWTAGLDVGDSEDGDRNALTLREWIIWRSCEEWIAKDTGVTARNALVACRPYAKRIQMMYDCIGVGSGVKAEYNRLTTGPDRIIDPRDIPFVPWHAGAGVLQPYERIIHDDDESIINKDFFDNLKAQAWWSIRTRFYKTFKAVTQGVIYPVDELISLDSRMPLLETLCKELAQPTRGQSTRLKMIINKKPEGTKSPNLADSGIQAFFPVPDNLTEAQTGTYGH